ncbi:hypothetical protein LRS12_01700 [Sphingomonas sp. J344]|uniref:hypothetical protein n=1 Tax=Sphingomonas sp. J344 TaxID=2898434 RepID=UPI002151B6BD|nr:hypothetical protein [Sphingomonas sp. J344]MCR5869582.1 hypothetical protein [Sphingomonas sp. J344]
MSGWTLFLVVAPLASPLPGPGGTVIATFGLILISAQFTLGAASIRAIESALAAGRGVHRPDIGAR